VAIFDPASSRRAVLLARRLNRTLQILVRTRYLAEVAELRRLGASAIIPEEFETSVEIFARVLREYEVPRNLILNLTERVRSEHYEVLRDRGAPTMRVVLPHREVLERLETASCWIRDKSPAMGQTVGELRLRSVTGATLVAVRRMGTLQLNPGADFRIQPTTRLCSSAIARNSTRRCACSTRIWRGRQSRSKAVLLAGCLNHRPERYPYFSPFDGAMWLRLVGSRHGGNHNRKGQ